MSNCSS